MSVAYGSCIAQKHTTQVIVQVIETQVIVWLGSLSAPLLPLMGLLNNTVTFEVCLGDCT